MPSQPSERVIVIGTVDPQTVANSETFTDVVDFSEFAEAAFVALLGNMANETVTFTVYECASDGSSAVALSGKSAALTASASANDNTQLWVNVRAEELTSAKRYAKAGLVTGGATGGPACVVVLGLSPRFAPASDDKLSTCTVTT